MEENSPEKDVYHLGSSMHKNGNLYRLLASRVQPLSNYTSCPRGCQGDEELLHIRRLAYPQLSLILATALIGIVTT